jgi:hypothetical protein
METNQLIVRFVHFQRNGIGGAPFHTVSLEGTLDGEERRFIATVFSADEDESFTGYCAVVEIDDNGPVSSAWRGDQFERGLRDVIEQGSGALRYDGGGWVAV